MTLGGSSAWRGSAARTELNQSEPDRNDIRIELDRIKPRRDGTGRDWTGRDPLSFRPSAPGTAPPSPAHGAGRDEIVASRTGSAVHGPATFA